MKKPNIQFKTIHTGHQFIDVENVSSLRVYSAYSEMIDALLSVNHAIENCKVDSGAVYLGDRLEYVIKETLKKAGCK